MGGLGRNKSESRPNLSHSQKFPCSKPKPVDIATCGFRRNKDFFDSIFCCAGKYCAISILSFCEFPQRLTVPRGRRTAAFPPCIAGASGTPIPAASALACVWLGASILLLYRRNFRENTLEYVVVVGWHIRSVNGPNVVLLMCIHTTRTYLYVRIGKTCRLWMHGRKQRARENERGMTRTRGEPPSPESTIG